MRNRPLPSRPRCPVARPNAVPTRSQLGGSRKLRRSSHCLKASTWRQLQSQNTIFAGHCNLPSTTWRDNIFRCNAFCTAFNFSSQRLRCAEEMADDQTSGDRPGLLQPQGAQGRSNEDAEAQPHSRLLPPPPANSEVAPRHDSNTPESALAPSPAFVSAHSHPHSGTALHPASRSRYTRAWHINRGPMHPHPSLRSSLTGLFSDAAGTAMAVGLTDTPTQRQLARSRKRFFV